MPAALITSWHSTSNASPVRVLMALTPCTLSWVQQPQHLAVGEDAGAVLFGVQQRWRQPGGKGSTVPSGTWMAPISARLTLGSRRQRLGGIQLAGVDARQGAGGP